ncbi:MAG TPA: carboxypeptidase regulatory-like domain-containing protein, partial [Methylomirabilota bacterium]|nr:carboxypeptidase regulatory-like domain-containing protein [Methylomirabilota bacterium]
MRFGAYLVFGVWCSVFYSPLSNAQETAAASVAGVIVNTWNGVPLPAVVVTVRGTTLAVQTDANGRFELKNVPPGDQVLRFSKSGYASAVVTDVRVLPGQTTTVNGNLRPEFFDMEEYEVTAEEFVEQTEKILFERQQAGGLLDAIGSEQFSKLGASDAGAIVSRVTGVSVVGGKYAVVRGLSDRYTRTLLNGVEVPSADPYRMSPQLDLFPSAMIDRVSVSKTFTPDQPGGSGGGAIDIITKPFPEEPFVKATIGTSYNPNSNLKKNFLADPKSSMDMFALPGGPSALNRDLFSLTERINKPNNAVGSETPQRAADRRAQANKVSGLLQEMGTTEFAGVERDSPLNSSINASAGRTVMVMDHPLGMFASMNYSRRFELLDDYDVARYGGLINLQKSGQETRSNIKTDYGGNVNLGYRVSDN